MTPSSVASCCAGIRIHQYETVRLHKSGERVEISLTLSPIRDRHGELVGYSTIERDISERRKLERMREESTRFLRNVLNTLPILVGAMSPEGVLLEANRAALNIASLSASDVIGKSFDKAYWWSYSESSQRQLREAIDSARRGETVRYDARMRIAEGQYMICDFMISPMLDSDGNVSYLISSATDITERKQREEEVLRLTMVTDAQRRRLNLIIANVPGIVFDGSFDRKSSERVDFISDYATRMLGYSIEELRAAPNFWQKFVHPDDQESLSQRAQAIFESGEPGTIQFRCFTRDGRTIFAEAHVAIVDDDQAKQITTCGVIMDITARREIEEALTQYTQDLRRSNDELEQFAYVASHDLQEPLRMVTSYLQLIKERYSERLDDDGLEFIRFAVDGAARMKSLIDDLLAYSRLQRDQSDLKAVSMEEVLEQVCQSLYLAIEDSGAIITHDPLPEVMAVEGQMFQLLQNLIANAIKFRREETPHIQLAVQNQNHEWIFSVADNGIGIDPEYLERIFVVFQRLHPHDVYPGTGIGLAICRRIVEGHGGHIWAESQPGQGTSFHFSLPVKPSGRRRVGGNY